MSYYVERTLEFVWSAVEGISALMSVGLVVLYVVKWPDIPNLWPLALMLVSAFAGRTVLEELLIDLFFAVTGSCKVVFLVSSVFIGITGYGAAKVMDGFGNHGWMITALGLWGVIVFYGWIIPPAREATTPVSVSAPGTAVAVIDTAE